MSSVSDLSLVQCLAIDFSKPDPLVVFQILLFIAHAGFVWYRHKQQLKDISGIEARLDQFLPRGK